MKLLRTTDRPDQKYTLAFVGYGDESQGAVLELTYNYGVERYDLGTGYGHVAIEVPDAEAACDAVRAKGGNVTREAGPVKGGTTVIAFVQDPDGYKIELIERGRRASGAQAALAARSSSDSKSRVNASVSNSGSLVRSRSRCSRAAATSSRRASSADSRSRYASKDGAANCGSSAACTRLVPTRPANVVPVTVSSGTPHHSASLPGRVRAVGQHVERQVRAAQPREVLRLLREAGEHDAPGGDPAALRERAQPLAGERVRHVEPQHRVVVRCQRIEPRLDVGPRELVGLVERAQHEAGFRQAHAWLARARAAAAGRGRSPGSSRAGAARAPRSAARRLPARRSGPPPARRRAPPSVPGKPR